MDSQNAAAPVLFAQRQGPYADPIRALWIGVLVQAWEDAQTTNEEQTNACLFLTQRYGDWLESREVICDAIGLHPEWVRERAAVALAKRKGKQVRARAPFYVPRDPGDKLRWKPEWAACAEDLWVSGVPTSDIAAIVSKLAVRQITPEQVRARARGSLWHRPPEYISEMNRVAAKVGAQRRREAR